MKFRKWASFVLARLPLCVALGMAVSVGLIGQRADAALVPQHNLTESFTCPPQCEALGVAVQAPATDLIIEEIYPLGYAEDGDCLDMVICVEPETYNRIFCIVKSPLGLDWYDRLSTKIMGDKRVNTETGIPEVSRWKKDELKWGGWKIGPYWTGKEAWQKADKDELSWYFHKTKEGWVRVSGSVARKRRKQWVGGTLGKSADQFVGGALLYTGGMLSLPAALSAIEGAKVAVITKVLPKVLPYVYPIYETARRGTDKAYGISLRISVYRPMQGTVNELVHTKSHVGNYMNSQFVNTPYQFSSIADMLNRYYPYYSQFVQGCLPGSPDPLPETYKEGASWLTGWILSGGPEDTFNSWQLMTPEPEIE